MTLISKVQYKNFEPGEFVDVQERNYEETIELIKNFPWNSEREKIVIDLTNPSITIEGKRFDYLKMAVFFNEKYVLHYFDEEQVLYTHSFINLPDTFDTIKRFFEQPVFDIADFKKETTWLQHNLKHFVTQDFNYVVTSKTIRNFLLNTSGVNFAIVILLLPIILLKGFNHINFIGSIALSIWLFLFGGGLHLFIFFSYYRYVKNKILIMSQGNDVFYFGNINKPVIYNKKDISQYIVVNPKWNRNPLNGFAVVIIEFKDGSNIKIPNLLTSEYAISRKLFEYPRIERDKLPFLKL